MNMGCRKSVHNSAYHKLYTWKKWNHSYPETKKCICLVRRDKWKQKNKQKKQKMNVLTTEIINHSIVVAVWYK